MNRIIRNTGFYLLIFLVTVGIVHFISTQNDQKSVVSYGELRQHLMNKNVESIIVKYDAQTYLVRGKLKNADTPEKKKFRSPGAV